MILIDHFTDGDRAAQKETVDRQIDELTGLHLRCHRSLQYHSPGISGDLFIF